MELKTSSELITNVRAIIRDDRGEILYTQEGKNSITKGVPNPGVTHNGLVLLLERLFDNGEIYDPADCLNKMQLGSGTPSDSGLGSPVTSPVNTLLAFTGLSLDQTTPPSGNWYDSPKIIASCTWGASFGELNGISEAGLIADGSDTTLFAYKTFSPVLNKTANGEITIEWTIQVSYQVP